MLCYFFALQTYFSLSLWPLKISYLLSTWFLINVKFYGQYNIPILCLFIWSQLTSKIGAVTFGYLSMVLLISFNAKRIIPLASMVKKEITSWPHKMVTLPVFIRLGQDSFFAALLAKK
jgi:hypothetical protein